MKCTKKGCYGDIILKDAPNTIHYAKECCEFCGKWYGWVKNPNNLNKRTKTSKHSLNDIARQHNYEDIFCFFCLRTKEQLGSNQTMTIDHIKELQQDGEDNIENLQILCSACHKLKNWMRLYNNWHYRTE